jgi:hypothetical protein
MKYYSVWYGLSDVYVIIRLPVGHRDVILLACLYCACPSLLEQMRIIHAANKVLFYWIPIFSTVFMIIGQCSLSWISCVLSQYSAWALKMEAVCTSETLVPTYQSAWRHNSKDQHRYLRRENLKSHLQPVRNSLYICVDRLDFPSGLFTFFDHFSVCFVYVSDAFFLPRVSPSSFWFILRVSGLITRVHLSSLSRLNPIQTLIS